MADNYQPPLFVTVESDWRPPAMVELPSDWNQFKRMAIDVETKDDHLKELGPGVRRGGYVTGVSLGFEDGPGFYLPIRHEGGDNMDAAQVIAYLRHQAARFTGTVVGAHLQYDLDYLWEMGIEFPNIKFFRDVQVAAPLLYELHMSYSLENIAQRYGLPGKNTELMKRAAADYRVDPYSGMWRLPARFVGPYALQDTMLPLQILRRQEREIEEQGLENVFDLESRVLPVLVRMRRRGVRFSWDRLRGVEEWSLAQEAEALAQVKQLTGVSVQVGDVWKPEPMAAVLLSLGIDVPKTAKGQYSVRRDILDTIDHPAAALLLRARKVNKLRTTFAASIRKFAVGDRIHCTFNQLPIDKGDGEENSEDMKGARYGRLSCEMPNMQQQPARDEFAKMWRSIYLPEDGKDWFSNDYSQQEPRWTMHFAEKTRPRGEPLPRASEAAQKYRDDPDTDNHQMMADLSGVPRKQAKELFLGKVYGMGGKKLCTKLHLPTRWGVFFTQLDPDTGRKIFGREYAETVEAAGEIARRLHNFALDVRTNEVAGEEGQKIIDRFDEQLPFLKQLAKVCEKQAKSHGFIRTVSGRRCRFPQDANGQYDWTHKALNRLIQGSSADQTKTALVEVDRAGHYLQLQVHDELNGSCDGRQEAEQVAEIMRTCVPMNVPSKVDVEVGPSWGEAE